MRIFDLWVANCLTITSVLTTFHRSVLVISKASISLAISVRDETSLLTVVSLT